MQKEKQQVIMIHGGGAFDTYEEYLADLGARVATLERIRRKGWKDTMGAALGEGFDVLNPKMPNPDNAKYLEWKVWFEKMTPLFDPEVILVGHSLGGIFLAKYLSENDYPGKILATLLVSAPYSSEGIHSLADFILTTDLSRFARQGGKIFLYQSRDDDMVPFSNVESFQKELPEATARIFEDRGYFNQEAFPEIVEDIKTI